ncbi:PQQ-binding-like beta-propeller repeat protein [Nocardiopsis coralliicola]
MAGLVGVGAGAGAVGGAGLLVGGVQAGAPGWVVLAGATCLAGVLASVALGVREGQGSSGPRTAAAATAAVALIAAVPAGIAAAQDASGGIPDPWVAVVAVGALLSAAGAGLMAAVRHGGNTRPFSGSTLIGATAAVLLLAGAGPLVEYRALDASRAGRASPPPVPDQVSGAAWSWTVPSGEQVIDAAVAGPGMVVRTARGVYGIDTGNGTQVWHYRRPGAETGVLRASADGSGAVATFATTGAAWHGIEQAVVFDAFTGAVKHEYGRSAGGPPVARTDPLLSVAGTQLILPGEPGERHVFSAADGSWRFIPPADCWRAEGSEPGYAAAGGTVVTALFCGDTDALTAAAEGEGEPVAATLRVLALDAATGREEWRHEESADVSGLPVAEPAVSADGAAVAIDLTAAAGDSSAAPLVLDAATGSALDHAPGLPQERTAGRAGLAPVPPPFTADAFLDIRPVSGGAAEGHTFSRIPLSSGESDRYAPPITIPADGCDAGAGQRPPPARMLEDALLTLCWDAYPTDDAARDAVQATVTATPWEGGDPVRIPVEARLGSAGGSAAGPGPGDWPASTPLFAAPGAVVVAVSGLDRIVGLQ